MSQSHAHREAQPEVLTLSPESAGFLMARLEALAQAARVFGSGMAELDVHISWSLYGEDEEIRWVDAESGRPGVRVQLALSHVIEMLRSDVAGSEAAASASEAASSASEAAASASEAASSASEAASAAPSGARDPEAAYLDAFKAGFLHELGHILYSGHSICAFTDPAQDPLACVVLDEGHARLAAVPGVREVLRQICLTLEDARVERRLTRTFRGARRFLEGHAEQALELAHGADAPGRPLREQGVGAGNPAEFVERLVAVLFLQVWGLDRRIDRERVPAPVLEAAERLRGSLERAVEDGGPLDLATWVGRHLLPEIEGSLEAVGASVPGDVGPTAGADQEGSDASLLEGPEETGPGSAEERRPRTREGWADLTAEGSEGRTRADDPSARAAAGSGAAAGRLPALSRDLERRFAAPDLLASGGRGHRLARGEGEGPTDPVDSQIIVYPHVDRRMVLDELPVASASKVRPSEHTSEVARDVVEIYGPMALAAFAGEAAALRRAFQVNHERRVSGRHRSGKRVGVSNMRRFVASEDLRLFQRIEVPDRLSYYFHLLVDVSPSMLTDKNAQKAVATAYAFADALERLRVPVDVTLYSSAVTVLHDHRVDALDLYFGGRFGYLSSGTHEIEAIAYAKRRADSVVEERKIVVVVTDGQPNSLALQRAGSDDLRDYYRAVLIPWLARAGIDLMAVGIGTSPGYHRDSVSVSSSWESIGVLMRLLDDIIARGEKSHSALWA